MGWASTSPGQPCSLRKRGQRGRMRTPAVSPSFSTPHPDLHSSSGSLPLNLMTMLRSYPPTQPSPSAVWVHQGRVPQLVQQGAVPGFSRGPRGGDQGVGLPVSILRLSQIHLALACVLCCPWASTRAAWGRGGGVGCLAHQGARACPLFYAKSQEATLPNLTQTLHQILTPNS